MNHEFYIQRCIQLANLAKGKTYPNPMVGSVIVYNDTVIGEGYHKKAGEPHAEINAIASVADKNLIPESTIYVTLEPCSHYGKTPPCALKIKELGFKKVVIGILDSHDKVNGKGIQILEDARIEVETGILNEKCRELNKRFFTYHEKKRPYIILKWAESSDKFIDKDFKPTQIGNEITKQWMHQLRAEEHAIMVGTTTALSDNPTLTTREVKGRNPIRIVIDLNLKIPSTHHIFNTEAETIVLNSFKEEQTENIKYVKIETSNFISSIGKVLYENQIQSVLIEGGALLLQQFIDAKMWDECFIIKNNSLTLENGTKAPEFNYEPREVSIFESNTIEHYRVS